MVKPISQPRSYEGYGSGAATPDSTRLPARVPKSTSRNTNAPQQARPQGWKPTVSRQRPDLPQNPKPREQKVAKPQQAPAPKPTGVKKPRVSAKVAAAAGRSAAAGVSPRTAEAPPPIEGGAPKPGTPVKTGKVAGLKKFGGKGFLWLSNAFVIGTTIDSILKSKETANEMWSQDPSLVQKYASPQDLERDLQGEAVAQAVGGITDTMIMVGAQRAATSLLVPLVGAGPAGWIAMGIAFFVLPVILDELSKGNPATNPGEDILQATSEASQAGLESVPLEVGPVKADVPLPVFTAFGAATKFAAAQYTSVFGLNFADQIYRNTPISDVVRIFGWDNAKYRTPEQKQQLRVEMGAQQWNYDGTPLVTYKTFGPRTEEVKAVLGQGFFLKPVNSTREVIYNGKRETIREFIFDYQAFTDWFEKSMWIAGVSNDSETVKAQTRMLPALNPAITSVITDQNPLTDSERRALFEDIYSEIYDYATQVKD